MIQRWSSDCGEVVGGDAQLHILGARAQQKLSIISNFTFLFFVIDFYLLLILENYEGAFKNYIRAEKPEE